LVGWKQHILKKEVSAARTFQILLLQYPQLSRREFGEYIFHSIAVVMILFDGWVLPLGEKEIEAEHLEEKKECLGAYRYGSARLAAGQRIFHFPPYSETTDRP